MKTTQQTDLINKIHELSEQAENQEQIKKLGLQLRAIIDQGVFTDYEKDCLYYFLEDLRALYLKKGEV